MSEKRAKRRARLKEVAGRYDHTYRVVYIDGQQERATKMIECDRVVVDAGLIRFLNPLGNDRWTVRADRVIEYEVDV